jgi:anaerobic magnesium-protoporphyrin IX monomethyl ester cyclase
MDILFVISKIDYGDQISLSYLASVAEDKGFNSHLCILDIHDIFEMMDRISPRVVAYSANVEGFNVLVEANKSIKNKYDFVSIMGGPQPTFRPDLFLESSVDVFCVGEGELVLGDFLEAIKNGSSFDDIDNLITKRRINPVRQLISDLDDIPFPNRDLTIKNSFLKDVSKKSFYTTRGCPFACSYCCNNYYRELYKGKGKAVRRFSVDRIIGEMKAVKEKYKMDFIKIGDDLFASKADDWLREFTDRYSKEIDLPFNCYLRLDMISDELLTLLKRAGCHSVHLSVDSCSKRIREEVFNRKWREVDIEENLKLIHSYGIKTWVNFMLAAPGSTLEDDLESIELCRKAGVTYAAYSTTIPIQHTMLFDYCVEKGIIDSDYDGEVGDALQKSPLNSFSEREKTIRYNIFLLGPIASKLPYPLYKCILFIIKHAPSNRLFGKIHDRYLDYSRINKIFKLKV